MSKIKSCTSGYICIYILFLITSAEFGLLKFYSIFIIKVNLFNPNLNKILFISSL